MSVTRPREVVGAQNFGFRSGDRLPVNARKSFAPRFSEDVLPAGLPRGQGELEAYVMGIFKEASCRVLWLHAADVYTGRWGAPVAPKCPFSDPWGLAAKIPRAIYIH